jgi:hypothetical protein
MYNSDSRNVFSKFNAMDVAFIFIIQVVIARKKVKFIKRLAQLFQGPKAIVHSSDIETISVMVPITEKNSDITPLLFGLCNVPVYKI